MSDSLEIRPVLAATFAHRTASSACCGAKLSPGTTPGTFTCRDCGQPCERVMSGPEEVVLHG